MLCGDASTAVSFITLPDVARDRYVFPAQLPLSIEDLPHQAFSRPFSLFAGNAFVTCTPPQSSQVRNLKPTFVNAIGRKIEVTNGFSVGISTNTFKLFQIE
jgi:hypothetical protein